MCAALAKENSSSDQGERLILFNPLGDVSILIVAVTIVRFNIHDKACAVNKDFTFQLIALNVKI